MRRGPSEPAVCVHEALVFATDRQFVDLVAPILAQGVEAGEATVATLQPRHEELIRAELGDAGISFVPPGEVYDRPASTIRTLQQMVGRLTDAGAPRVRIVGEIRYSGLGGHWDAWARYEATVNHALAGLPLSATCAYDARTTPDEVLADVAATHPYLHGAGGREANEGFRDPAEFLGGRCSAHPDPIESSVPAVELANPSPEQARRALEQVRAASALDGRVVEDLTVSVSEVVANAHLHGRPPVVMRVWGCSDRIVVTVSDGGPGPADPFAGLVKAPRTGGGGLGLWIAHQLCSHVDLVRSPDGFTVRLVGGTPFVAHAPGWTRPR